MTNVNIVHNNVNIEITYNDKGYLDQIKNIDTNEYLIIESKISGIGYNLKKEKFIFGNDTTNVCDARYVRIMDLDIFVPKFIFIINQKIS